VLNPSRRQARSSATGRQHARLSSWVRGCGGDRHSGSLRPWPVTVQTTRPPTAADRSSATAADGHARCAAQLDEDADVRGQHSVRRRASPDRSPRRYRPPEAIPGIDSFRHDAGFAIRIAVAIVAGSDDTWPDTTARNRREWTRKSSGSWSRSGGQVLGVNQPVTPRVAACRRVYEVDVRASPSDRRSETAVFGPVHAIGIHRVHSDTGKSIASLTRARGVFVSKCPATLEQACSARAPGGELAEGDLPAATGRAT